MAKIQHAADSQAIARARQLAEPPAPALHRQRPQVVEPGMTCVYELDPPGAVNTWHVINLSKNGIHAYVTDMPLKHDPQTGLWRTNPNSCTWWVTVDLLHPFVGKRPKPVLPDRPDKPAAAPKPAKEPGVMSHSLRQTKGDDIGRRLAECDTLDELWDMAAHLGLPDTAALRKRLSHLNPGLQRMNIGNRLRTIQKHKEATNIAKPVAKTKESTKKAVRK